MKSGAIERRRIERIPVELPVVVCTKNKKSVHSGHVKNISKHGAKLILLNKLSRNEEIVLQPDGKTNDAPARATVRWCKTGANGVETGVKFEEPVNWKVPLKNIIDRKREPILNHSPDFQRFLESIEASILILNRQLKVVALNRRRPFCMPLPLEKLIGHRVDEICNLLELTYRNDTVGNIIQEVFDTQTPYIIPSIKISDKGEVGYRENYYRISFTPLSMGSQDYVVIHCVDNKSFNDRTRYDENNQIFLLQCRYAILGRIFSDLLEDIVNPLSAAIGRSDLIALKIKKLTQQIGDEETDKLLKELYQVQKALGDIKEFCKAATRRRYQSSKEGGTELFSLNALIEDELSTLELHSIYKKLDKRLELADDLPPISGNYADWVYAFVALMQVIVYNMGTIQDKWVKIWTKKRGNNISWGIEHNGKALPAPIERLPDLIILQLLKDKYGIKVKTLGATGRQQITLEMPLDQTNSNA